MIISLLVISSFSTFSMTFSYSLILEFISTFVPTASLLISWVILLISWDIYFTVPSILLTDMFAFCKFPLTYGRTVSIRVPSLLGSFLSLTLKCWITFANKSSNVSLSNSSLNYVNTTCFLSPFLIITAVSWKDNPSRIFHRQMRPVRRTMISIMCLL